MTRDVYHASDPTSGFWMTPLLKFTTMWARAIEFSLTAAANGHRAPLASFSNQIDEDEIEPAPEPSLAYTKADWQSERSVDSRENLSVGDYVTFSKTITDDDIRCFAETSGDTNRLHLDGAYAEGTRFGDRIAHGTLVTGLISAALALLPGTVVYLSQDTSFLAPVHVGETLTAECRIAEELDKNKYRLTTTISNQDGDSVIDGEATVLVDPLPEDPDES